MTLTANRRNFLQAAGATASTFTILKSGSARTYAANEKLNIAAIGAGGRAAADIQEVASQNIVALCDVDQNRAAAKFRKFPEAKKFKDYRVMLQELEPQVDAVLMSDWNSWQRYPEQRAKDYGAPPKKLARSPGHHVEWIEACKGGSAAGSNFDVAGPMTEAILLGNVALRSQLREPLTRAQLEWDAEKMAFTNNPAANQFLRREYRDGWV